MVANPLGIEMLPTKPGSAGRPVCGYDLRILDAEGHQVATGEEGEVAIRLPLPPGCLPNLWNNTERFKNAYLARHPGYFASGDGGYVDEDGYVFITGRLDDIINVAGHRLSTSTMEEVVAKHSAVAECAVVGMKDELKGEVPLAIVVLKANTAIESEQLQAEVIASVREEVGPIASLKKVIVVAQLPKTRSGKVLRRTLRSLAAGEACQIPSTIEDAGVIEQLSATLRRRGKSM